MVLLYSIEEIEEGDFEESGIENITIPIKVNMIPKDTFENFFNLQKVIIPDNMEIIDASAFQDCRKLKEKIIIVNKEILKNRK